MAALDVALPQNLALLQALLAGVFAAIWTVVLWALLRALVFGPIVAVATLHRFTKPGANRASFGLCEMALLVLQLQLATLVVWFSGVEGTLRATFVSWSWLLLLIWWWDSIRLLSHAHITIRRDRWMLLLLAPLGNALATLIAVAAPMVLLGSIGFLSIGIIDRNAAALGTGLCVLAGGALHVVCVVLLRRLCRGVAHRAEGAA